MCDRLYTYLVSYIEYHKILPYSIHMIDLDTKQLRSFLCLAVEHSFSEAARQLGCSQATMSVRIQKLEETLGTRLFDRGPHEVKLTAEGRDLLPDIRALVDMHDRMYERTQTRRAIGKVRLGIAESYEASLLPGLLKHMQQNHAAAELDITCRPSWRLQQLIDSRTLDLAVVTLPEESPSAAVLHRPRLHWVGAPELALDPLLPLPVAWHRDKCFFRDAGIAALKERDIAWREVLSSDDSRVIQATVNAGAAVTVMADGTVPERVGAMSASSLLPPLGKACIQLLERPGTQSEACAVVRRELMRAYRAPAAQLA